MITFSIVRLGRLFTLFDWIYFRGQRGTSQLGWNRSFEKAQWWEPSHSCGGVRLSSRAAPVGLFSSGLSRGVWILLHRRRETGLNRLRKNSCFVSGHDFSRAVHDGLSNMWALAPGLFTASRALTVGSQSTQSNHRNDNRRLKKRVSAARSDSAAHLILLEDDFGSRLPLADRWLAGSCRSSGLIASEGQFYRCPVAHPIPVTK
jgi:hypothetical protein